MKRTVPVLVGLVFSLVFAAGAAAQDLNAPKSKKRKGKTVEWAKNYLLEVKKHLRKSFVEADRVSEQSLIQACTAGLVKSLDGDAHKKLDAESREGLREVFMREGYKKISEVFTALQEHLAAGAIQHLSLEVLADSAAKSMVESVSDPYSHIFTFDELQKMMGMLSGQQRDDNLGFSVAPKSGRFEVGYVMYGYPAYWAGLQMGDEVQEINGADPRTMKLQEVAEAMKVKPGDSIALTVNREGWLHPYRFTIKQEGRKPSDVVFKILPGDIGYLRLTIFDMTLENAVKSAMDRMAGKGIQGLILDLRQNPGGALNAAVAVADQFIPGKSLITKTESSYQVELPIKIPGFAPGLDSTFYAGKKSPWEQIPMAVLINHTSASASELLSGALQDLDRATLIGETSYGKGVGQTVIPLWRTGFPFPERYLYLTVMRYTLPTGRSIHGKGVEPDIHVPSPVITGEEFDRLWKLRESGAIEAYVEAAFAGQDDLAKDLATYDRFETERYPGFDGFCQGLKTNLPKSEVREEVRRALRIRWEREHGASLVFDLQTDVQLQQAVMELADRLGLEQD